MVHLYPTHIFPLLVFLLKVCPGVVTAVGRRLQSSNIGVMKFSAQRSKSQQPNDLSTFFANLNKAVKSVAYRNASIPDLEAALFLPQRAAMAKLAKLKIGAASLRTFKRFLLLWPTMFGKMATHNVIMKSYRVAGKNYRVFIYSMVTDMCCYFILFNYVSCN